MAHSVEMPELGESVTEGTVTQWLKKVGDTVEVDEPLLEVSTDKVDTEIPSPASGVLLKIIADEDDTVDVGAVIAEIGEEGETAGSADSADSADEEPAEEPADEPAEEPAAEPAAESKPAASNGGGAGTDVTMPELGESVTEGTITQWLKKVGDEVEVDEPLLEVSTDKVDTEVPSPVAGTLLEILAEEDDTIDVGGVIARVGDASAAPAEEPAKEPAPEPEKEPEKKAEPAKESAPEPKKEAPKKEEPKEEKAPASDAGEPSDGNLPYVTPLVRKLAEKHGVDLSSVEGTGVGGRIRKQDVLAVAEGGSTKKAEKAPAKGVDPEKASLRGTTQKVNRIRAITAKTTLESLHGAAQLTQVHEVDMTHVAELRKASKAAFQDKHGLNLTFLPFFAKAIVEALVAHPNVNASYNADTQEMTYHGKVNLGIAVDTKDGLLSPVIHDAQDMSLPELAQAIADIADRARNKKLKPNDVTGGTFTITNIGSEGALTDTPILVPPQAAMIGTGAIRKRPVVITEDGSDSIAIRSMVYLPMTYDHQVVDGADAGRFLTTVRDRLENIDFSSDLEIGVRS
ncbi:MAG: 2-oxoglutarate dehydrogenase, E2 component, dihydrolipoamide succinyltransferase [Corynebacterium sp.]|uniref:2-oxoglutarate dehydrogenase, E2 component, dihydrolipoamide succinyltransferase n=1 Tax=unclassified Corynebacterium TaxID=2624378 RepID=UPI0026483669|nr:2-oxoglutarate dehydrogenase, E2 component, dihydrolipoamide succinyltransferase [Corynebacterium sp.]MDN5581407.1 2-oxoglutarate dehydrogenase, E2 component, dihydrolipoamide succinyltransferase [Corynebacterium sp.]MDN5719457.1 2-oxoglutarate dehydrogenase, E2 component, dihydrolipoamide succinyltransferase [Corynebacterium sp.]